MKIEGSITILDLFFEHEAIQNHPETEMMRQISQEREI